MVQIDLKALQNIELDIFKEFKRVCEKNDLKYVLNSGTCIGAIRHKGFIPWDDDIDIAMPRDDYEKLVKIAPQELSSDYFFQNYHSEKNCGLVFGKIRKNNTIMSENYSYHLNMHQGVWIDIFPYDKLPDNLNERKKNFKKFFILKNLYIIKCGYKVPEDKDNLLNRIIYYIAKFLLLFVPIDFIINKIDYTMRKYNQTDVKEVYLYGCLSMKNNIPCDMLDDLIEVDFETEKAKVFKNYDYYLRRVYGNYMELPPIENRINGSVHFLHEFKEKI